MSTVKMTYLELRQEVTMDFDNGDPWGSSMSLFFDVAIEMFRRGLEIPEEWMFRPGLDARGEPGSYIQRILHHRAEDESLERLGDVLHRYTRLLEAQGRSY